MFNFGSSAATKERMRRGGRLLSPLSRYRQPIGMGCTGTPITDILQDAAASDCLTTAFAGGSEIAELAAAEAA
jgi:hypothetical protein